MGNVRPRRTLRKLFLSTFLLLIAAFALDAQQLSVTYLEGRAELQSGSKWRMLSIGDVVSSDGVLRLGDDGYVELSGVVTSFTFSQPGTYFIHNIVSTTKKNRSSGVGKALVDTLQNLIGSQVANQSTVMGARGANESRNDQPDWVSSDTQVFLDAGREYIKTGEYQKAIEQFQQAQDAATEKELPEVRYNLALAYSLKGDSREAVLQIRDLEPTGRESWMPDFLLLKAELFVETNAFQKEIGWLSLKGRELGQDAKRAQLYYFLLALGYQGVGDTPNEREYLSKVISLSSDSDVGKAASKILEDL